MNDRGFTLFEILATLLIFCLGILVLAGTQILSTKGTAFNREATAASSLAQKKIEEMKQTNFDAITNGNSPAKEMTLSWNVVTTGTSPYRMKDVTVTVSWASKNITLCTIIGE